ncbi:MAG: NADAR family protein [Bermanella sp.]
MSIFSSIDEDVICIARNNSEHGLSSFASFAFELEGLVWPSVEHYFQSMKFPASEYQELIRQAPSAKKAQKLGRSRLNKIRKDWAQVRVVIMTRAVYTQCRTHSQLSDALLKTQEKTLVDNTQYDYFWGCGRDRRGENAYGKVLMSVRDKLREEQQA